MNKKELILLAMMLLAYLGWFALPVSRVGTLDFRMVDAFNVDESEFLVLLKNAIKSRSFNIPFNMYGHLYFNNGLIPLMALDSFFPVTEQHIIIFFRILSALYFAGTVMVVFMAGKKFFGIYTAWISTLLLFITSSQLYSYSAMVHPDTAQLFYLTLSLYFCCNYFHTNNDWKQLVFSSIAAGLAFSTKYAGVMLLPIIAGIELSRKNSQVKPSLFKIVLALVLSLAAAILMNKEIISIYVPVTEASASFYTLVAVARITAILCFFIFIYWLLRQNRLIRFHWLVEKLSNLVLLISVFFLAFAITSPGCLYRLSFINGFISVTGYATDGHWFKNEMGAMGWFTLLISEGVLSFWIITLATMGVLLPLVQYNANSGKSRAAFILVGWIVIYFTVLVLRINADFHHYLLPVIPAILLLAANAIERFSEMIIKRFPFKKLSIVVVLVFTLILGYSSWQSMQDIYNTRNRLVEKVNSSDAVIAGLWLNENFSQDTKILYDRYVYIPSSFKAAFSSWGITETQTAELTPDLVVTNEIIERNFANADSADDFIAGRDAFLSKHHFYKLLIDKSSQYSLLKDFGTVKIYETAIGWSKNTLSDSENNYDFVAEHWSAGNSRIDSSVSFSGSKSELLAGEYSATYGINLAEVLKIRDTLKTPLFVNASVKAIFKEGVSAFIVIDFIRGEKSMGWQGKALNDFAPESGKWNDFSFSRQVPDTAMATDQLRVYLWNQGSQPLHLDDFRVEIYSLKLDRHEDKVEQPVNSAFE